MTYFDYLTVDPVSKFARFIKGEKRKIMHSRVGAIAPVATPMDPPLEAGYFYAVIELDSQHVADKFFVFLPQWRHKNIRINVKWVNGRRTPWSIPIVIRRRTSWSIACVWREVG